MSENQTNIPMKYYVDFENVHGAGLKGIDGLDENDVVYIFFSQAAETFHIEHAIGIMNSKARVEFVEIDGGTRNALDFQLVAALFGRIEDGFEYAIVSGDVGFDAAIKMGERLGLPPIRRISDLTGSTEPVPQKATRRRTSKQKQAKPAETKTAPEQTDKPDERAEKHPEKQNGRAEGQDEQAEQRTQKTPTTRRKHQISSPQAPDGNASQPQPESPEGEDAEKKQETSNGAERSGRYSKRKEVKATLAENGITLNQQQLSAVMKSLNGVKNKQHFYRSIIQSEGQERGLELYRKVRDHYDTMLKILQP